MFYFLVWGVGIIAGAGIGLALGIWYMQRRPKRNKGGIALVSGLFMANLGFNQREQAYVQEFKDETKRKKDALSGDPPETGE
jgi:hypothetical protein